MKRGKDKQPRKMQPSSLGNLKPVPQERPEGFERVTVDVFLPPSTAKTWRKLTPKERGARLMVWLGGSSSTVVVE